MKPLFINIFSGDTATITAIATLLAIFGAVAIIKSARQAGSRKLAPAYDIPFPTGNISNLNRPGDRDAYSQLFSNEAYSSMIRPTGSVAGIGSSVPESYAGPVVVEGSKYQWESRWSHLPSFEQGREGEERVVNALVNCLGNGSYIFRNFVLPTEDEDIDVVLVGPTGVFAMEVKSYAGEARFERNRCYIKTVHGRVYRQRREPVGQVRNIASKLNYFFSERGITLHSAVKPLMVMSGESPAERASAQRDVCTVADLRRRVSSTKSRAALNSAEVKRLAAVLQSAAREQTRANLSRVH